MPDELPIACTLTAAELPLRQAQVADLGRDALVDSRRDGAHAELRFAAGAGVRERVDSLVDAESECCSFLAMRVEETTDEVRLIIDAPEDAELVLAELVQAFRPEPQAA